jgi:hypothetical protein
VLAAIGSDPFLSRAPPAAAAALEGEIGVTWLAVKINVGLAGLERAVRRAGGLLSASGRQW